MAQTQFEAFLEEEVRKVKGIYYPVRAGFLRLAFIKSAKCSQLHPNPDDEFCNPEIGLNYEIMSRYRADYAQAGGNRGDLLYMNGLAKEPLEVEKTRPDGYMILNGHHRWGAACQVKMNRLSIKIVDLTRKSDIQKMLNASKSDRRVTLDLDEVVFRPDNDPYLEKQLPFPMKRVYKERIRLGIPALFQMMSRRGYDIWIYTARYYSLEYLRYYFRHYGVRVVGIVTGTARKGAAWMDTRKELDELCDARYKSTIHIDDEMVVRTVKSTKTFEEFPLSGSPESWSSRVMDVFDEIRKHEKDE